MDIRIVVFADSTPWASDNSEQFRPPCNNLYHIHTLYNLDHCIERTCNNPGIELLVNPMTYQWPKDKKTHLPRPNHRLDSAKIKGL